MPTKADNNFRMTVAVNKINLLNKDGGLYFEPFSFSLNEHQNHCVITGPSGTGKTTFFKCLIPRFVQDYIQYDKSLIDVTITVDEANFYENEKIVRIGYASQHPYFVAHQSVHQNLISPFTWSQSRLPANDYIMSIIDDFFISDILNKKACKLSGGEKQRLNLARMFLARPQIAIIDECFSSFDEDLSQNIINNIITKYSKRCKILITGHRSQDLSPFTGTKLIFAYKMSGLSKKIHVRVCDE